MGSKYQFIEKPLTLMKKWMRNFLSRHRDLHQENCWMFPTVLPAPLSLLLHKHCRCLYQGVTICPALWCLAKLSTIPLQEPRSGWWQCDLVEPHWATHWADVINITKLAVSGVPSPPPSQSFVNIHSRHVSNIWLSLTLTISESESECYYGPSICWKDCFIFPKQVFKQVISNWYLHCLNKMMHPNLETTCCSCQTLLTCLIPSSPAAFQHSQ